MSAAEPTAAPPSTPSGQRRNLLLYAIGFDLVLVAVGISLLVPPRSGLILTPFVAAVGLATWRGRWKVGLATTAFSLVALWITFEGSIPTQQLLLFALTGIAASTLFDMSGPEAAAPALSRAALARAAAEERARAERSAARRRVALPFVMYVGLPTLVLVVYLNLSYVLIENFSVPSILQPLILVLAGIVLHYRDAFRPLTTVLRPPVIALIAYCLVVFTSSNWARDVAVSNLELTDLVKSLLLLIVAASLAASWRALRGALVALVAGAVLLSLIALLQVAIGNPDLEFGGLAGVQEGHLYEDVSQIRPAGPVGDPNYFARILILAFPAAAFLGIGRTSRREQLAYLAAAGAIALAVLFTYSRGAMLTLVAVALLLIVVGRVRITRTTVAIGLVGMIALIPTTVGRRLLTTVSVFGDGSQQGITDASVDKRKQLLGVAWTMFNDHPVAGVGVGNFGSHYAPYANLVGYNGPDYTPLGVRQYAHNLYLETAVETGLLGLGTFLMAMTVMLAALHRARRHLLARGDTAHAALVTAIALAIVGYLLASVFLQHSGFQRYLWLILGLGVAALRLTEDDPDIDGTNLSGRRAVTDLTIAAGELNVPTPRLQR